MKIPLLQIHDTRPENLRQTGREIMKTRLSVVAALVRAPHFSPFSIECRLGGRRAVGAIIKGIIDPGADGAAPSKTASAATRGLFKKALILILLLASMLTMRAGTNDLTALLQRGLFEEEANHNLEAAMQAYQSAIAENDKDRKLVATAVFRLGECLRKQGKTNEATAQYQRVLREFADQEPLVKLSKSYLGQGMNPDVALGSASVPITSAEEDEVKNIRAMIQNSPDLIDAPSDNGLTPLQNAAFKGHLKTAEYLIANGADVNKVTDHHGPPINCAASNGQKAMVELLLARGAKVDGTLSLLAAAGSGFRGVAEVLIAAKEDVNEVDNNMQTPLHKTAEKGFQAVAEMLISNKATVNSKDKNGQTPLHLAAKNGKTEVVRSLLAHQAQVNAKDSNGATALLYAIDSGRAELVKLLLENGADTEINSEGDWRKGTCPLSWAVFYGRRDLVELLLSSHANPNAKFDCQAQQGAPNWHGCTPLLMAIEQRKTEIIELLLDRGADPNLAADSGNIPLAWAVQSGQTDVVQLLIKHKANLDIQLGNIPLLVNASSANARAKIVEMLCASGLNVNERDKNGCTALHYAVQGLAKDNVEILIAHGADVNAPNDDGKPPIAYTKSNSGFAPSAKQGEIADILRKAGATDNYERLVKIWVKARGTAEKNGVPIFYKGTNSLNRFSVVETIGFYYASVNYNRWWGLIQFPDLSNITISRLKSDGTITEIPVNLTKIILSGDRAKDVWLQWGDVIEIGQEDHKVEETWHGLPEEIRVALTKWMLRKIDVVVKGQNDKIVVYPKFSGGLGNNTFVPPSDITGLPGKALSSFELGNALRASGLLLISSDLSRVAVKRANPVGDEPREVVLNETGQPNPDLWLRDGDVIEVPERDPNAPDSNAGSRTTITIGTPMLVAPPPAGGGKCHCPHPLGGLCANPLPRIERCKQKPYWRAPRRRRPADVKGIDGAMPSIWPSKQKMGWRSQNRATPGRSGDS